MDLRSAELKGVTKYASAVFSETAWWEVKSINKPFLEYLVTQYPLRQGTPYGPEREIPTQEAYHAAISRLKSQLK
jgi:hypothetical protein